MTRESGGPQRTCGACRTARDKKDLVRFVLAPDGSVLVDYRQRLPGRGVYTCFDLSCLTAALKKNVFRRGFRKECQPVALNELQRQLCQAVEQKILTLIGIARKSGQIVAGTQAVLDLLKSANTPALVLLSDDISSAIGDKIRRSAESKKILCAQLFDKELIGQLLGKEERSAIAMEKCSLASTVMYELQRLEQLQREI